MANKIQILSERIANKIAAGEVVERPASIVKELIENALDAGATSIEVEVSHGGKSLIRVADNGCGMTPHDAELAFKRHATSKIKSDDDLAHIESFGFRGEALPSIAAVSRMTLSTRTADAETGTEILMIGGAQGKVSETACAPGTVVEVRDLFFNTPARRKFLKQDSTEYGHIYETLAAAALAKPGIRFVFKNQDKVIWDLPAGSSAVSPQPGGNGDLRARVKAVLGGDWDEMLIPVQGEIAPHIQLSGFITKPQFARGNRMNQYIYVNHRWVKSFAASYAMEAGYHGFLMHGRYPAAVLFLQVNPQYVDVNVHPTKQQVRLSGESTIKSLIQNTVAQALSKSSDLSPTLVDKPMPAFRNSELTASLLSGNFINREFDVPAGPAIETGSNLREAETIWGGSETAGRPVITKVLGQVHGTFILAETEEGYIVIDQHAAHEKIQYESLRKNLESADPVSQKLLIEEMIELNPRHIAVFEQNSEFLRKTGFEVELFGENTLIVRSVPHALAKESAKEILTSYLDQKETGEAGVRLENYRADLAAMLACKTRSVKAHDFLNMEEMRALTEELMRCEHPFHCPHGRPSILKYSFAELERQFKRKL